MKLFIREFKDKNISPHYVDSLDEYLLSDLPFRMAIAYKIIIESEQRMKGTLKNLSVLS